MSQPNSIERYQVLGGRGDDGVIAALARQGLQGLRIQVCMQHCLSTQVPAGLMIQLALAQGRPEGLSDAVRRLGLESLVFYRGFVAMAAFMARHREIGMNLPCTIQLPEVVLQEVELVGWLQRALAQHGLCENQVTFEVDSLLLGLLTGNALSLQLYRLCDAGFGLSCVGVGAAGAALMAGRWRKCLQLKVSANDLLRDRSARMRWELAERLRIAVVAEGISDPAQLSSLVSMGVRYGQGELFPVPGELAALLD